MLDPALSLFSVLDRVVHSAAVAGGREYYRTAASSRFWRVDGQTGVFAGSCMVWTVVGSIEGRILPDGASAKLARCRAATDAAARLKHSSSLSAAVSCTQPTQIWLASVEERRTFGSRVRRYGRIGIQLTSQLIQKVRRKPCRVIPANRLAPSRSKQID